MTTRNILIVLAGVAFTLGMLGVFTAFFCCWRQSGRPSLRIGRRIVMVVIAMLGLGCLGAYLNWRRTTAPEYSAAYSGNEVQLGRNASLGGHRLFPPDHPWNTRVDESPLDSLSEGYIAVIGPDTPLHPDFGTGRFGYHLYGIPYMVVDGSKTKRFRLPFSYEDESDDVFYPIPAAPDIEDGGDRHLLIIDRESWRLYELFGTEQDGPGWRAGSGATWDMNSTVSRPAGWTSSDAAGMQLLPGLARTDEVYDIKQLDHALRFTVPKTARSYRYPARHHASSSNSIDLPPMGMRLRLKLTILADTFPPGAAVVVRALQRYGMILADNGGPLFLTGTADRRWKRRDVDALRGIRAGDFEVVATLPPPPGDTVALKEAPWKRP